jgi:ring-1,2-phenylacetyl-CoA epoxidase subunit PaaD
MSTPQRQRDVESQAWHVLDQVLDPEIPVLSIVDLGIVRSIRECKGGLVVGLSPTYSGCPATEFIEASVITALENKGFGCITVMQILSPPWTTDWISDAGREKLKAYGIVPPEKGAAGRSGSKLDILGHGRVVRCPRCDSVDTQKTSEFGSTPCKASYKCTSCLEPFEYFKCI